MNKDDAHVAQQQSTGYFKPEVPGAAPGVSSTPPSCGLMDMGPGEWRTIGGVYKAGIGWV